MLMICPKCGSNLSEQSAFCTSCGARLSAPPKSNPFNGFEETQLLYSDENFDDDGETVLLNPTNNPQRYQGAYPTGADKVCPRCGAVIPADSRFCPQCAMIFTSADAPIPPKKKKTGLIIGLVIAAVVVIAAVAAFVLLLPKDDAPQDVPYSNTSIDLTSAEPEASTENAVPTEPDTSADIAVPTEPEQPHSYQLVIGNCSWWEAQEHAALLGGHLVTFDDESEYLFVLALIDINDYNDVYFRIGARREPDSLLYHWVDASGELYGDPLNVYDAWCAKCWLEGEPNYEYDSISEEYLEIYYSEEKGDWVWNDTGASPDWPTDPEKLGYIIEFDQ